MARKLQIKRGLQVKLPTLADGEFGLTTDQKKLYIGCGGNVRLATEADITAVNNSLTNVSNKVSDIEQTFSGGIKADSVAISESTRNLYGLTVDNANVDKALEKTMQGGLLNALLTGFVKTADVGNIMASDNLLKVLNKLGNNTLKIVQGTYVGDNVEDRFIDIGVAPILVYLSSALRNTSPALSIKTRVNSTYLPGRYGSGGMPYNDTAYRILGNGFFVGAEAKNEKQNYVGVEYTYIALV